MALSPCCPYMPGDWRVSSLLPSSNLGVGMGLPLLALLRLIAFVSGEMSPRVRGHMAQTACFPKPCCGIAHCRRPPTMPACMLLVAASYT